MADTKIDWTDKVWNPVTGCAKIGSGCLNCYAERMTRRFWKAWGCEPPPNHFKVQLHPERLEQPLHWKKPRRIFVNSMSDLFHDDVPFGFVNKMWGVVVRCPQHAFQILTKRPARMRAFFDQLPGRDVYEKRTWCKNVHLLVSASTQKEVDEAVPILLEIPAAVRGLSLEPLLGPILFRCRQRAKRLDWVIVGGESGPGARPMHPYWVRGIRDQCVEAGIPFFFKGWGKWCHVDQMPRDTWDQVDIAHNLAGHGQSMWPVGKKNSGRILDGRTWEEYPRCAT